MTQFRLGYVGKTVALATVSVLGTIIAACGGGGTIAGAETTVSPYVAFATSYTALSNVANTDPVKWNSLEGGSASVGTKPALDGGTWAYEWSDLSAAGIAYRKGISMQFAHSAASDAADYIYLQVKAPENGSVDISQSGNLVIAMGNNANQGTALNTPKVFSIFVEGGTYNAGTYSYANSCSIEQDSSFTGETTGLKTYKIPLSSLTCGSGSLSGLKSNVKAVTVKVLAAKNSSASNNSTSLNSVAPTIGFISFTK